MPKNKMPATPRRSNSASLSVTAIAGVLLLLIGIAPPTAWGQPRPADVILMGGTIYTVDAARPRAAAIAISKDRILAVGSNESMKPYIGNETKIIDLDGKFAMPGFIEGHAHFVGLGESMMMLNLQKAKNWDEIVAQVAAAAKTTPPGEWIIGRGWHQSKWDQPPSRNVEGYPTAFEIDKISPDHPVLLTHASGHMNFANGYAMRLAGIDAETNNPTGGEVLKDNTGAPIGVFRETAQSLVSRILAQAERTRSLSERSAHLRRAVDLASKECLSKGVTSFQDAGSSFQVIDQLKDLAARGKIGVRLWVMIRASNPRLETLAPQYKMIGFANDFLTVRAIKRSIDGALGSHGAWLLSPYDDMPASSGLNTSTVESVTESARIAIQNDFQFCVHAIGDRANREVLDIYEKLFSEFPSGIGRRWRIEHAQHLSPQDIPRFASLDVIASMQAIHCTSDAVYVPTRLGIRRSQQGAYVWQSLIGSGAIVTNGTDAPVEDVNPLSSFYASTTRQLKPGITFFPEQVMTRQQAVRAYTIDAAYAAFEESIKGSLVPGKLADIVVLSHDLINCTDDEIKETSVLMTIVGGKIVYQRAQD